MGAVRGLVWKFKLGETQACMLGLKIVSLLQVEHFIPSKEKKPFLSGQLTQLLPLKKGVSIGHCLAPVCREISSAFSFTAAGSVDAQLLGPKLE